MKTFRDAAELTQTMAGNRKPGRYLRQENRGIGVWHPGVKHFKAALLTVSKWKAN